MSMTTTKSLNQSSAPGPIQSQPADGPATGTDGLGNPLLPQQKEAIAKQHETSQQFELSEMEKRAIRDSVNSWMDEIGKRQLEAGSRHRLTLTISPEQRYVCDRVYSEQANDPNTGNPNPERTVTSANDGRPGLR